MSRWIKICGNTSLEDARLAADAGADAVGFVFAPSPRQVNADEVAMITARLPSATEKIGVFVNAGFDEIEATVRTCGLTGVQLHFDDGADLAARLRQRFGPGLRILRVLHFGPGLTERGVAAKDDNVDGILIDSRTATAVGGTGVAFDWEAAESLFRSAGTRLVVAGGLTPLNVAEAVRKLQPWGVDVVSGVEAAPGRKDPDKVRTFVATVKGIQTPP